MLCPAKLNLALAVGPPNPQGMHPIASWMLAIDWYDDLTLLPGDRPDTIAFADDALRPEPVDWPLERDLAVRARQVLADARGQPIRVSIELRKRIPTGAGLGGGSSDAAGVLVGLNRLLGLNWPTDRLVEIAQPLGSDIAFFIHALQGHPAGLVTGQGEQFEPTPPPALHACVMMPEAHCNTAAVYQAFDAQASLPPFREAEVQHLARAARLDADDLFNDLASPAMQVAPPLAQAQLALTQHWQRPVHITGSGAALFTLADSPEHAQELARITPAPCPARAVSMHPQSA